MNESYDAIIIGAGMSGLAAGIRLAMFDQKVLILEKHLITGGLNSYYERRERESRELMQFDVGLHALTNFAKKGERKKPLTKLLKQLRIPYDSLELCEQTHSLVQFKSECLKFSNDFNLLESEISQKFPAEIDNFQKFVTFVSEYNEVDLSAKYISSKEVLSRYFKSALLSEMLMAPLLIYGSAWERDMDFSQFVIMFKSLYFEGFSRPKGGVRTILKLLEDRFKEVGGELRFRSEVSRILSGSDENEIILKNGDLLKTKKIFSSAGLPETYAMVSREDVQDKAEIGNMSFMESLIVLKDKKALKKNDATIIFYNDSDEYSYEKPDSLFDSTSAVVCLPDNYERENLAKGRGIVRVTNMANFSRWNELTRPIYKEEKEKVYQGALKLSESLLGEKLDVFYKDIFSPTTVKKYTGHFRGTVYGSTTKRRDGQTEVDNLHIIGTDQGFLGIVGAMLSGISIANLYGLRASL